LKHTSLLLKYKADPSLLNDEQLLPIHWASMNGRKEIVEELLKYSNKSTINMGDPNGRNCVHLAGFPAIFLKKYNFLAQNGHTTTLQYLLDNGGLLEGKDCTDETALHKSCNNGSNNSTRLLLERGASLQTKNLRG
jgi:ankyrin repeat protein